MRVLAVDTRSPLFGRVHPGYEVKSINGRPVLDSIDFRFRTTDERVRIRFADPQGDEVVFRLDGTHPGDLGLTLDDGEIRVCDNDCIFCFVRQQPKGMRPALYVKDEDYRLSFTHGNFITLSNTSKQDIERIIRQRLSPLYVSVHTTDDNLRRRMFRNETLAPIVPRLRHLAENGITIHAQVVLCPDINDGPQLERTINDLSSLYPGVETLAIVPVGLTRYRANLPKLRPCTQAEAAETVGYIETRQREFLRTVGSRFVWTADEFYVIAGYDFPRRTCYEAMSQFENGVGMAREFVAVFNRRRARLKHLKSSKRVLLLTGYSAYPFLCKEIMPYIRDSLGLSVSLHRVFNRFWGETVTVSGLLTGQDLLHDARMKVREFDTLVLPPNCLNGDDLFLDNLSLRRSQNCLGKEVIVGSYDLPGTLEEVFA